MIVRVSKLTYNPVSLERDFQRSEKKKPVVEKISRIRNRCWLALLTYLL